MEDSSSNMSSQSDDSRSSNSFRFEGSSNSLSDISTNLIPGIDPYVAKKVREEELQMRRTFQSQREVERQALTKEMEDDSMSSNISFQSEGSSNSLSDLSSSARKVRQNELQMERKKANKAAAAAHRALKKQIELEKQQEQKKHAMKAMTYLLSKSQNYSKFLGDKLATHLNENASHEDKTEISKESVPKTPIKNDTDEIPKYFTGGTLRPYQMEGLTWLKLLFENGINGILADEMGLGKTIQVISLLAFLYEKHVNGPFLIIAPLSVITNWLAEFKKFAPKLPVIFFHGDESTRKQIKQKFYADFKIDGKSVKPIVITSYQVVVVENTFLAKFKWGYVILDEAQYIKNSQSQRYISIDNLHSVNRLLLTGTPLQNNLTELWALLHFLMPNIFGRSNSTAFTSVLNLEDFKSVDATVENAEIKDIISTIHGVINPFLLRRLKQDVLDDVVPKKEIIVYCPLTDMQRTLTKYVLERNLNLLAGKEEEKQIDVNAPRAKRKCSSIHRKYEETDKEYGDDELIDFLEAEVKNTEENRALLAKLAKENKQASKDGVQIIRSVNLASPFMALRELASHPYLLHMPTVLDDRGKPQLKVDENLINTSGKMRMLDLLLTRLKAEKRKVLIYSCFVMMLDIVEEYLIYRNYKYARLDGRYQLDARNIEINKFCKEKETFVFLITTRAGGVGLNLVEADTVIFTDIDFNPQVDIQAQDRCHRIGQTKPVVIYKLVSLGTVDEQILKTGEMKKRLEKVIIKNGRLNESFHKRMCLNKDDLQQMLKSVESSKEIRSNSNRSVLSKKELDQLMDRSDLNQQLNEQLLAAKINHTNKRKK